MAGSETRPRGVPSAYASASRASGGTKGSGVPDTTLIDREEVRKMVSEGEL